MIYLDYSATTGVDESVLDTYISVSKDYIGNVNSLHKLGIKSKELQDSATRQIASLFNIKESEIIYTSGASESNNTAIKGVVNMYKNRGNKVLTTKLEHSSIIEPLENLKSLGFEIVYLDLNSDGTIDIDKFKKQVDDNTILVTIASISSELGINQPINEIGKILREYPKCIYHVDMTQSIGKVPVDFDYIDLASMSFHKLYGPKGIGLLYKRDSIKIAPLIEGGKSTTIYRSGTPALPLIVSSSKALRLSLTNLKNNYNHVLNLNSILMNYLNSKNNIHINSTNKSIPHIINISIDNIKSETMIHALEEEDVYISTRSACSSEDLSDSVYTLTGDKSLAQNSLRISISHLTSEEEINSFVSILDNQIERLNIK